MATRVTLTDGDLAFLYDWAETYEGPEDDDNVQMAHRLMAWARQELDARAAKAREDHLVRLVAQDTGRDVKDPAVRKAVRAHLKAKST